MKNNESHRFRRSLSSLYSGVVLSGGLLLSGALHAAESVPLRLPAPRLDGAMSLERALHQRQSVREFRNMHLTLGEVSQLLWAAQGMTRDGRGRTTPSAGALYPLEIYLVAGQVEGLAPGIYRYEPAGHGLIAVKKGDVRERLAKAALGQASVRQAPVVLVIAGVHERTTKKYGARAGRYVWIEAGHAGQNVYLQAQTLGLATVMVGAFDDQIAQTLLALPSDHVLLGLMPVGRH